MNSVAFGETVSHFITVLINPLNKIGGHPNIERSVSLAGKQVDTGLFIHISAISHPCELDSGNPCRNDGLLVYNDMLGAWVQEKNLCLIHFIMTPDIDQNNLLFGNDHFQSYPIAEIDRY